MAIYLTINNGIVDNAIELLEGNLSQIELAHDHVILLDGLSPQPWIGWSYDENTETFSPPVE
jgi:hypothetical protein